MRRLIVTLLGALAIASPAWAQDAACAGFKWPVDRELTAFATEGLPAVAGGGTLPGLVAAATLKLAPQETLAYPVPPTHKPKHAPGFGGAFPLPPIAATGTYQVTVSGEAWIDVVQDGKLLKQVGFTASRGCRAVRKSVRFSLGTGPATVEISDAETDSLKLEVLPKEQ